MLSVQASTIAQRNHIPGSRQQGFADEGFNLEVDEARPQLTPAWSESLASKKWDGETANSWPERWQNQDWSAADAHRRHISGTNRRCGHFKPVRVPYKARGGVQKVDVNRHQTMIWCSRSALRRRQFCPNPRDCL